MSQEAILMISKWIYLFEEDIRKKKRSIKANDHNNGIEKGFVHTEDISWLEHMYMVILLNDVDHLCMWYEEWVFEFEDIR